MSDGEGIASPMAGRIAPTYGSRVSELSSGTLETELSASEGMAWEELHLPLWHSKTGKGR